MYCFWPIVSPDVSPHVQPYCRIGRANTDIAIIYIHHASPTRTTVSPEAYLIVRGHSDEAPVGVQRPLRKPNTRRSRRALSYPHTLRHVQFVGRRVGSNSDLATKE